MDRSGDAALAVTLALQQRRVAHLQQLILGHRGLPLRDAHRSGHPARAVGEQHSAQARERAPGGGHRALDVGVREDHDELVAAVARHAVESAELTHQRLGDLTQDRVTRLVTVTVVDELEVVEVHDHARQPPVGAMGAADLLVQTTAHRAVVQAPGNRVGARLRAGTHEREHGGGLVDKRVGLLDRVLVVGLGLAPHEHHHRLDLSAERQRGKQCATGASARRGRRERQPRNAGGQLARPDRQEAASGARHPADPRRALLARLQIAEPPVAVEHVHDHQLLLSRLA